MSHMSYPGFAGTAGTGTNTPLSLTPLLQGNTHPSLAPLLRGDTYPSFAPLRRGDTPKASLISPVSPQPPSLQTRDSFCPRHHPLSLQKRGASRPHRHQPLAPSASLISPAAAHIATTSLAPNVRVILPASPPSPCSKQWCFYYVQ